MVTSQFSEIQHFKGLIYVQPTIIWIRNHYLGANIIPPWRKLHQPSMQAAWSAQLFCSTRYLLLLNRQKHRMRSLLGTSTWLGVEPRIFGSLVKHRVHSAHVSCANIQSKLLSGFCCVMQVTVSCMLVYYISAAQNTHADIKSYRVILAIKLTVNIISLAKQCRLHYIVYLIFSPLKLQTLSPDVCNIIWTLTVLVATSDAQWEGMGDVRSARYEPALLPPCPTIRVLSYSN